MPALGLFFLIGQKDKPGHYTDVRPTVQAGERSPGE